MTPTSMSNSTPTPAAGSKELESEIDEVLVDMTYICNDCEHPGCLARLKSGRKHIMQLITAQNDATYVAVMEAIGKDDRDYSQDNAGKTEKMILVACSNACNDLRTNIRQNIAKIFGKEPSDE